MSLFGNTCAVEVKQTKTNTLYANSVKPHQISALKKAKHGVFKFKIPDLGQTNPFDFFVLKNVPAYVVVIFGDNTKAIIDVDDFPPVDQKLTKEQALKISQSPANL